MRELDMRVRKPQPWELVDHARQVAVEQHVVEDLHMFELRLGLRSPHPDDFDKPRYSARLRNQVHEYFKIGERPPEALAVAANAVNKLAPPMPPGALAGIDEEHSRSTALGSSAPLPASAYKKPLPPFLSSEPRRVMSATPGKKSGAASSAYSTPFVTPTKARPATAGSLGWGRSPEARSLFNITPAPGGGAPGSRCGGGSHRGSGGPGGGPGRGATPSSHGTMSRLEDSIYRARSSRPATAPPRTERKRGDAPPFYRHVKKQESFGLPKPETPLFAQHFQDHKLLGEAKSRWDRQEKEEARVARVAAQREKEAERRAEVQHVRALHGDPIARRKLSGKGRPPPSTGRGLPRRGYVAEVAGEGRWGVQGADGTQRSMAGREVKKQQRQAREDAAAVAELEEY